MDKVDILIVGAGVVGLSVAAELSQKFDGRSIMIIERHGKFGQEISSRNSEVIHAGIYYPAGSLKSKLCVEGNRLMYDFCREWEIPYQRVGKLIVAMNDSEIPALETLMAQGKKNGVADLELIDRNQLIKLEPNISAVAAIYSPSTGIIDSHRLMMRLKWLAEKGGTMFAYHHEVIDVEPRGSEYLVICRGSDGSLESVLCTWLINCAGLQSDKIASMLGVDVDKAGYRIYPCKGEYFSVPNAKAKLLSHLVYPPPLSGLKGLGVHVTKTLDGRLRLGPNASYVDEIDYNVDATHAEEFYNSARMFLPFLDIDDLQPDMSGIRPKVQAPGAPFRDFVVCHEVERGFKGLINLIGIESPGLTSSLSLSRLVSDLMEDI